MISSSGFEQIPSSLLTISLLDEEENDKVHEEIDLCRSRKSSNMAGNLDPDQPTRAKPKQTLLAIEHRTCLWLYLTIEGISGTFKNKLWPNSELIKWLPSSVEDAYEKILDKVPERQREVLKMILHIIVAACHPVKVGEIAAGIATSSDLRFYKDSDLA
jgi:hypothetical protein